MKRFKGTIIENSLQDKELLKKVHITDTRQVGDWILHDVVVNESLIPEVGHYLSDGPWYIHMWQSGEDRFVILFKDRFFWVNASDPSSFKEAIEYGKSIGIPGEQLDFPTD